MRTLILKLSKAASLVFALSVLPIVIVVGCLFVYLGKYKDITLLLAYFPGDFGNYVRLLFYRLTLKGGVGKGSRIHFGTYCQDRNITIGNNCSIGTFNALGLVDISNDVITGSNVNFVSGLNQHGIDDPSKPFRLQAGSRQKISIENDVWIGSNSVVCASIGSRVVVGVGSVVVTELLSNGVYAGNKAKLIRSIP